MGKVLTRKKAVISEGLFDLPKGHIPLLRILAVPSMHQVLGDLRREKGRCWAASGGCLMETKATIHKGTPVKQKQERVSLGKQRTQRKKL